MSEDFARSIKPLPWVASQILRDFDKSTLGVGKLAQSIETDPVLTGQVLKIANSSYYAVPGGVQEVRRALRYLGFEVVRQIALSASLMGLFSSKELEKRLQSLPKDREFHLRGLFSLVEFWRTALILAKILEKTHGLEAFAVGLVHGVGKWVVLDQTLDLKPPPELTSGTWSQFERELAELAPQQKWSYAEWSALIAQQWGFNKSDVQALSLQEKSGFLFDALKMKEASRDLEKLSLAIKDANKDKNSAENIVAEATRFAEACLGTFDL